MNLVQQAEQLKHVPDQTLSQMSQGMSSVPPYLVVAEMQRRESMRKSYQASQGDPVQQQTVVEEMRSRFNQAAPPQPQMQQPQQGQPMRFAEGGAVEEPGGGVSSLMPYFNQMAGQNGTEGMPPVDQSMLHPNFGAAPAMGTFADEPASTAEQLQKRYATRSLTDVKKEVDSLRGKSRLEAIADELAKRESEARNKKQGIGQILMQLGLGMAASRRPDFAGAVGEGGLQALQGYSHQREQNLKRADELGRQRAGLAEALDRGDDHGITDALGMHAQEQHNNNAIVQSAEATKRAELNQKQNTERSDRMQTRMETVEGMKETAAERRAREHQLFTAGENELNRQHDTKRQEAQIAAQALLHRLGASAEAKTTPLLTMSMHMLPALNNEVVHLQTLMNSANDPGEIKAIKERLQVVRKQYDAWQLTNRKELQRIMPGSDFSAFDEQQAPAAVKTITKDQALNLGAAPTGPSARDKAGAAAGRLALAAPSNAVPGGLENILGGLYNSTTFKGGMPHANLPWNK